MSRVSEKGVGARPAQLTTEINEAFDALTTAVMALQSQLRNDADSYAFVTVPPVLPGHPGFGMAGQPQDDGGGPDDTGTAGDGDIFAGLDGPAWTPGQVLEGAQARELAIRFFAQLRYTDEQDPREAYRMGAVLSASRASRAAALALNDRKADLEAAVADYRKACGALSGRAYNQFTQRISDGLGQQLRLATGQGRGGRSQDLGQAMRRARLGRVCLMQAYRRVQVIDTVPASIGFSWSKGSVSTLAITPERAAQLLEQSGSTAAQIDRRKLADARLPAGSPDHLRLLENVAPHLRANLRYPAGVIKPLSAPRKQKSDYLQVYAALPLLVLGDDMTVPSVRPPRQRSADEQVQSPRRRLEDEPFLPSINVWRLRASAAATVQ